MERLFLSINLTQFASCLVGIIPDLFFFDWFLNSAWCTFLMITLLFWELGWTRYILWFNVLVFAAPFSVSNHFGTLCIKMLRSPMLVLSFLIFLSRFYAAIEHNSDVTLKSGKFSKTRKKHEVTFSRSGVYNIMAREHLPSRLNLSFRDTLRANLI